MKTYPIENLLREPVELYSGIVMLSAAGLLLLFPVLFLLTPSLAQSAAVILVLLSMLRIRQGYQLLRFHRRLLMLPKFSLSTEQVPISKTDFFIGKGFEWLPIHRQRLHLLGQTKHAHFLQLPAWKIKAKKGLAQGGWLSFPYLSIVRDKLFRQAPEVGGKPWLHGVGSDKETTITLAQSNRNRHAIVFGMTRVGKTRLLSILINQDIRNGEAVLVIDPKGDVDLIKDMYAAAKTAGRLNDFRILHAGMPDISAKYNPLALFSDISEVATRVTGAISAEGEGKQFADFAWRYLNITATCLKEMGEPIQYRNLSFFVTKPRQLLMAYCDKVLPQTIPTFNEQIEQCLQRLLANDTNKKKQQNETITRADAIREWVAQYIETTISEGNYAKLQQANLSDLYHAAKTPEEFYGKITASLAPVFDKINKTAAGDIFSWDETDLPVIQLEDVVQKKQICYIGLDSMSNRAMSEAVGQAVIADLISLCGRLYKNNPAKKYELCLHADELAEMVKDEFITLVNKAGGAGIKVTGYTQTMNDLGAVFGTNPHKAKMLLGNFGTVMMLQIANLDTARLFTECLQSVQVLSGVPSTTSQDKSFGENGELFSTSNTDMIQQERQQLIVENDLFSLPKGQAFVLTQGGKVYKIRIPLPTNDENQESNIAFIMSEVNRCYAC